MNDFGILISEPGATVDSSSPDDMAVSSSYDTLKMDLNANDNNFGYVDVYFANAGNVAGTSILLFQKQITTKYTNLFYFEFDFVNSDIADFWDSQFGNSFYYTGDGFFRRHFEATRVGNLVEFRYIVDSSYSTYSGDTLAGNRLRFKYYFFVNESLVG
jgi:hypothetical protein